MNTDQHARLSVAPMIDWTDRHCRYLHRQISQNVLLYTEMIASPALVRGKALHLLDFSDQEHPVALQLGGSDPEELADAAVLGQAHGYDEINLNVGCPSDRVQSGCFGAVLMKDPALVANALRAMIDKTSVEVTVKCRIGVDDQEPSHVLPDFLDHVYSAGVRRVAIHARKAWLQGLSPKQNREVPPLDYDLVYRMKEQFPDMHISLNGGVQSLAEAQAHLARGLDGVMIGRAAYQHPFEVLGQADRLIFDHPADALTPFDVVEKMRPYIAQHLDQGGKLAQVTRHMLGLFGGYRGARNWRRVLSAEANKPNAGLDVLDRALFDLEAVA